MEESILKNSYKFYKQVKKEKLDVEEALGLIEDLLNYINSQVCEGDLEKKDYTLFCQHIYFLKGLTDGIINREFHRPL